jgi:DNA-binding MarR family transcriptional regulator
MKEDHPPGPDHDRVLRLRDEVIRIAASLAQLASDLSPFRQDRPANSNDLDVPPEVPRERVNRLIAARSKRSRYLSPELFGEPAWDILLDLLRAELAGEPISISSACIAADIPASTGLRWLKVLEQKGLVARQYDPRDARRTFVVLTSQASVAMRRYFLEVVGTSDASEELHLKRCSIARYK